MKNIVRIKKDTNFVVMDKTFLKDNALSWKAKGIMAYMLSMPDDWTFYLDELAKHSTDGKASFRSGFKELQDGGYVKRVRIRSEKGVFDWETIVYERPHTDYPLLDNPRVDKPQVDNQTLLSNDELSNEELNNDTKTVDHSSKIKDLLSFFSNINDFNNLNKKYWDVIRETRVSKTVAKSVIYRIMASWKKYDPIVIEYALKSHISSHVGKKEEYTLGIMRNTTVDEARSRMASTGAQNATRKVARF